MALKKKKPQTFEPPLYNGGLYFQNVNFSRHHNNVFVCVLKKPPP